MFSLFSKKRRTRLVKLNTEGRLAQYVIQEHSRVTRWTNAEPVFYATSDDIATEVYNNWRKKDEVTVIIADV